MHRVSDLFPGWVTGRYLFELAQECTEEEVVVIQDSSHTLMDIVVWVSIAGTVQQKIDQLALQDYTVVCYSVDFGGCWDWQNQQEHMVRYCYNYKLAAVAGCSSGIDHTADNFVDFLSLHKDCPDCFSDSFRTASLFSVAVRVGTVLAVVDS